jgi:2-iminobutanoate/2-iminopropanoate deaminase
MRIQKPYTSHINNSLCLYFILILVIIISCDNQQSSESVRQSESQNQLLPFSPMVEVNGTMYISGQISPAKNGETKSIESETREVMCKIGTSLNNDGYDFNDVVRCSVFLDNIDNYATVNKVYASFFDGKFPSRVAMEVSRLVNGAHIEISAIAIKQEIPATGNSVSKN